MAKLTIKFTMPSDLDADQVGISITKTSAQTVIDINNEVFVIVKKGLSPDQVVTMDVFEENDGTDLIGGISYRIIASPGDSNDNFNTDFTTNDVVVVQATAIVEVGPAGDSFEQTLVSVLQSDATIQSGLVKDKNGLFSIKPSGSRPVGDVFPQITYRFDEGPSEDAIPAARRSLSVIYWVDRRQKQFYKKMKTITDQINALVNRAAGSFQNIDVVLNEGLRTAGIVKTTGGPEYDDDINKHFWELIYDVVISEGESFATADSGEAVWV